MQSQPYRRGYNEGMAEGIKPPQRIIPAHSIPGDTHSAEYGDMRIDVYRLIHLTQDVPTQEVPIPELLHQMGDFCWTDALGKITPEFVVHILKEEGYEKSLTRYPSLAEHINKIQNSDYSFPIITYKGSIIDGMHRLAKAVIENQTSIKVKPLDQIPQNVLMEQDEESSPEVKD